VALYMQVGEPIRLTTGSTE